MSILVWTNADPECPDVYPDAETVQEYGAGHLRVWSSDSQKVIALYAPGAWFRTLRPDWPKPTCICKSPARLPADDPGGTIPLPIEIPGHREPWHDQRRDAVA